MNSPYTAHPVDALMAAQTAVGMTLTAVLWKRPLRPRISSILVGVAIWVCVLLPVLPEFFQGLGAEAEPERVVRLMRLSAGMVTAGALFTRRWKLIVWSILAEAALWWATGFITESDLDLAALHLCAYGVLVGLAWKEDSDAPPRTSAAVGTFVADDVVIFLAGVVLACLVAKFVLQLYTNSGDEWAYTFQAALLAKGRAYADSPRCSSAFQSFWVFEYSGRLFSQYTPGWPLFMAPFVLVRAVWLAGPCSLGLLAVGAARLARRALATGGVTAAGPTSGDVRAAGWFSAGSILLASTLLINGGSRYPHVFVAACFAWALEALCVIADRTADRTRQIRYGAILGATSALMLAARPADGGLLGLGIFALFVVELARRRITLRAIGSGALAFAALAGLTLVILHRQLGTWFTTGYSLNPIIHPWNQIKYSVPDPSQFRWGVPLATGSYCWWPCAPALGLAGLVALRGHARRLPFVFFVSAVPFLAYYTLLEIGRGYDFAYGPRYQLPLVVPMATGGGALLGALWSFARRSSPFVPAFRRGGPVAVALAGAVLGVFRIAPLVYPFNYADVKQHNRLHEGLKVHEIHNAVVFVGPGLTNTNPLDLTENWPFAYYDNDVVVALDGPPDRNRCVRSLFATRKAYRAIPGLEVKFEQVH
jgi:hypothetical protein